MQFRGVADEPVLDGGAGDFRMELEREDIPADGERLMPGFFGRGEVDCSGRQVKGVAVPMKHGHASQMTERALPARFGQIDRRKSDLGRAGIDGGAGRRRYHLRAETEAKRRPIRRKSSRDECSLRREKRIGIILIDPHRAT